MRVSGQLLDLQSTVERAFASIHDIQTNSHYLPNLLMHFLSLPNDLVFVVGGDKAFEMVT